MYKPLLRLLLISVCVFIGAVAAFGQTARFSGQVTDQQSAAIPGAMVRAINQKTHTTSESKTDGTGTYAIPYLPAGHYRIEVQAVGFSPFQSKELFVDMGRALIYNVQLVIGSAQSTVDVSTGGVGRVETETSEISGTISEKEVVSYGLNGRIATQLIALTPGVSNQTGQDEGKTGVAGSAKYSVNGGRVQYNIFEVDGSDVLNNSINASRGGNTFVVNPSVDSISEIKVLTSNYGAMYGRTASGIVQMTTKSGTKNYHGNLYEFVRNEMFNAKNYFDETNGAPLYRRNDFGGTIGGPLSIPGVFNTAKNKTFFFFSEEARLEKTPVQFNQAVPSVAERNGDFSDVCPKPGQTFTKAGFPDCPVSSGGASSGYSQFNYPSGQMGSTNLVPVDPMSSALLNTGLLPLPNSVTGCNNSVSSSSNPACYVATVSPSTYWREELFRIDHNLTPSQVLNFRFIHDTWNTTVLTPQWGMVVNSFPTVQNHIDGPGLSVIASLSGVIGNGFLNRFSMGYVAEHVTLTAVAGPGATLDRSSVSMLDNATNPIGAFFDNGFGGKIPGMRFKGTNQAYGGHGFNMDTGYTPWKTANPTYTIGDDISKTFGKHTLQFGGQLVIAQQNELGAANGLNSGDIQGILTFDMQGSGPSPLGANTTGCTACFAGGDTTNAFANFLGGQVASYTQDSSQSKYYNRYKAAEPYIQDNWHVSPHLTLNLGLRVGLFGSWYNSKGTAYNFVPDAYNRSLASQVYLDPTSGYMVRTQTSGSTSSVEAVALNLQSLDPVITNGLVQCGKNGVPKSCMTSHIFNPMPRIGFAWDVFGNGKTSLRGGYGIFFEHGTSYEANTGSLIGSAPLTLSQTQLSPVSYQCIGGYGRNGWAGKNCLSSTDTMHPITSGPIAFPLNVTSIPTKATYPYSQQWSLSLEQELQKHLVANFAYVGSKGTHLTAVRDINQVRPADQSLNPFAPGCPYVWAGSSPCTVAQLPSAGDVNYSNYAIASYTKSSSVNPEFFRNSSTGYGTYGDIVSVANIADSNYNAFQFSLRRTVAPLVLGVAYTYSHSIDDSSDRSDANFVNSYDLSSNKASSSFDLRHNLSISYIYDLPLLRLLQGINDWAHDDGSGYDTINMPSSFSRLTRTLFDQWQLSGITVYQTGTPFSIINGGSSGGVSVADNAGVANYIGSGSYADCVNVAGSNSSGADSNTVGPLLQNRGRYAAPRGLTFGNCGRNSANNPSRVNFNMALLKHFKPLGEGRDLEFRAEAFNIFNHTQFRIYDPTHPGNTGNNIIGCYGIYSSGYSAAGGGNPECSLGNSFLHPVDAHDPRILQFGLKLSF